jgi:mono/diheme cytochrome c family protein
MNGKAIAAAVISLAAATLSVALAARLAAADGVYSEAQAKRGEALYEQWCASCHGASLAGSGEAPPLTGMEFTDNWKGMTIGDLLEKMIVSMPAGRPRGVTAQDKADVIAYILSFNKFPVGAADLPADPVASKQIPFDAPQ